MFFIHEILLSDMRYEIIVKVPSGVGQMERRFLSAIWLRILTVSAISLCVFLHMPYVHISLHYRGKKIVLVQFAIHITSP